MARYIMSYFLSVSIVLAVSDSLNYSYPMLSICLITLVCFIFYSISLYNKKHFYITVLSLFSCAILTGIILSFNNRVYSVTRGVVEIFGELYKTIVIADYYLEDKYIIFSVAIIALLITFIVHTLTIKIFKPQFIIIGGIAFFVVCQILQLAYNEVGFFFFCFMSLLYYFEWQIFKHIGWNKKGHKKKMMSRGSFIAIGIVLIISSMLLTRKQTNVLGWIDDVISDIEDIFTNSDEGSYVEQDRTISDLEIKPYHDETLKMTVETDDIIYLRGMVFDAFDGSSWNGGKPPLPSEKNYEENWIGLKLLSEEVLEMDSFIRTSTATVKYKNLEPDMHFTHLNTDYLEEIVDETDDQFTYSFQYYQPRYDNPKFIELLRKSKKGLYGTIESNEAKQFVQTANQIYKRYTILPFGIPPRVMELAKNITGSYEADIDKVRAIETYLSMNYNYTLEPALPNSDSDNIVDYFLFESEEGFCIHYASAMVVMVRAIGLPARYITGYKLPYTIPPEELEMFQHMNFESMERLKSSEFGVQTYYVRDTDAHAWVEVYFEGFGWLSFEPTRVYYDEFHQYADDYKEYDLEIPELIDLESEGYRMDASTKWIALYGVISIILILLFLPLIRRIQRRKKYKQSSNKDKVIMLFGFNTEIIKLLYQPREPSCSIRQYIESAGDCFYGKKAMLIEGAVIFERSMYGADEVATNDVEFVQNMYAQLKKVARLRMKKISYIWYKYINKIM